MKKKLEVIKYDSEEAAEYKTGISGWVNRHGQFYGENEHLARWTGCTHLECSSEGCKSLVEVRSYTICDKCREEKRESKYFGLELVEWEEQFPVYSYAFDEYFFDSDSLADFMHDNYLNEGTFHNPRLVLCRPVLWRELDEEYFTEEMYEDCECPDELSKAIDNLNNVVKNLNETRTSDAWEPDVYRIDFLEGL